MHQAYVVHRIRGRTRVRLPGRRGDIDFFDSLEATLAVLSESVEARLNPVSSTILLLHPTLTYAELEVRLKDNGLFELSDEPPPPAGHALAPLIAGLSRLDQTIARRTNGAADGRTLIFIAVVAFAARQLARGAGLGSTLPLVWIASQLFDRVAATVARPREADTAD